MRERERERGGEGEKRKERRDRKTANAFRVRRKIETRAGIQVPVGDHTCKKWQFLQVTSGKSLHYSF